MWTHGAEMYTLHQRQRSQSLGMTIHRKRCQEIHIINKRFQEIHSICRHMTRVICRIHIRSVTRNQYKGSYTKTLHLSNQSTTIKKSLRSSTENMKTMRPVLSPIYPRLRKQKTWKHLTVF